MRIKCNLCFKTTLYGINSVPPVECTESENGSLCCKKSSPFQQIRKKDYIRTKMTSLWEKMRTEERKLRAAQLGVKVSDIEEMEELQQTIAVSQSQLESSKSQPFQDTLPGNNLVVDKGSTKLPMVCEDTDDSEYFDKDSVLFKISDKLQARRESQQVACHNQVNDGGFWHKLPPEVVDRILIILGDADMLGYLNIASKNTFQPTEAVYKYICMITYPMQTTRKALQVENWLTWRNMLIHRPRLRTNGFYTLRTKYSKGYCNDNFWEEKQFKSIEVKFYRHLRFLDHGYVLYSLDIVEPVDMARHLYPATPIPKRIFEGRYTLTKREVVVEIPLHYCNMRFELLLLDGDDGYQGKCNMLRLLSHSSTPLITRSNHNNHNLNNNNINNNINNNQNHVIMNHNHLHHDGVGGGGGGRVEYPLPVVADLRFHRFWNFSAKQLTHRKVN